MQSMVGTVVIAQEQRFQLLDRVGVGHLFLLHYDSAVEPDQLQSLLHRPVRVFYRDTANSIIGRTVHRIDLLEG
jgi:hypothetical protein